MSEENITDYRIELKGKPKLDVTQPDSETTKILKEFKDFELKPDGSNFREFLATLKTLYTSRTTATKKETYKLAEMLKIFPQIDDSHFQFEDRKKMTETEKIELASKIPEFAEDLLKLIGPIIDQISLAVAESMSLVDAVWIGSEKMIVALEGIPISIQKPVPLFITPKIRQDIAAQEMLAGKSASEIAQNHEDIGLNINNVSINAERGIWRGLKEGRITKEMIEQGIPNKAVKFLKANEQNV